MSTEILKEFFDEAVVLGEKLIDEVGPSLVQPISEYLNDNSDEILDKIADFFSSFLGG